MNGSMTIKAIEKVWILAG